MPFSNTLTSYGCSIFVEYYPCLIVSCFSTLTYQKCITISEKKKYIYREKVLFVCLFVCFWRNSPQWARASSFTRFLDHTQRHTSVGRTPLDEWSARRRDLYLTTHDTHSRQTSMPPVGFEPTISAGAELCRRPRGHWDRLRKRFLAKLNAKALLKLSSQHNFYSWQTCFRFWLSLFNQLAYTDVPETAGLARSINP